MLFKKGVSCKCSTSALHWNEPSENALDQFVDVGVFLVLNSSGVDRQKLANGQKD